MKEPDRDILRALASLEHFAEMTSDEPCESADEDAMIVTTFRRLAREAGYDIPPVFDWAEYLE